MMMGETPAEAALRLDNQAKALRREINGLHLQVWAEGSQEERTRLRREMAGRQRELRERLHLLRSLAPRRDGDD